MARPTLEDKDLEAYRAWEQSEEGKRPIDPKLLEVWRRHLEVQKAAYGRGERPLVTVMEEQGAETRGSWQATGSKEKPEGAELKRRLYVVIRGFIADLLESGFFDHKITIREAESKIDRELMSLEAKQNSFRELSEEEKAFLEILSFLKVQIPILIADDVVENETILFEVPDDLQRKIITI